MHLFAGTQERVFSEEATDNAFISCNKRVSLDFDGMVSDFNNKKGREFTVIFFHRFPFLSITLITSVFLICIILDFVVKVNTNSIKPKNDFFVLPTWPNGSIRIC